MRERIQTYHIRVTGNWIGQRIVWGLVRAFSRAIESIRGVRKAEVL